jgi:hypothetical protein
MFAATAVAHDGPPPPGDPQCPQVTANKTEIWPNGKFVRITLTVPNATQDQIRIYKVTQDEPTTGLGHWDSGPDAFISEDKHSAVVRAERSRDGDGRVYRIAFDVFDGELKKCSFAVYVGVPRDFKSEAVNSGQDYDSRVGGDDSPPSEGDDDHGAHHDHGWFHAVRKGLCRLVRHAASHKGSARGGKHSHGRDGFRHGSRR